MTGHDAAPLSDTTRHERDSMLLWGRIYGGGGGSGCSSFNGSGSGGDGVGGSSIGGSHGVGGGDLVMSAGSCWYDNDPSKNFGCCLDTRRKLY